MSKPVLGDFIAHAFRSWDELERGLGTIAIFNTAAASAAWEEARSEPICGRNRLMPGRMPEAVETLVTTLIGPLAENGVVVAGLPVGEYTNLVG